jgi:hypothetical protein
MGKRSQGREAISNSVAATHNLPPSGATELEMASLPGSSPGSR